MQILANLSSWAVDLKEVGAVYPWQGLEVIMVIVGIVLWIGWHIWQINHENKVLAEEEARLKANKDMVQEGADSQD